VTPGHEGIPGNERADEEAKVVAKGDSSLVALLPKSCRGPAPSSRAMAWQSHLLKIKAKSIKHFTDSPIFKRLRQNNPTMPSPAFRKATQELPCMQVSLLFQLRTGHILLQKYLHRIRKASSPKCPAF